MKLGKRILFSSVSVWAKLGCLGVHPDWGIFSGSIMDSQDMAIPLHYPEEK